MPLAAGGRWSRWPPRWRRVTSASTRARTGEEVRGPAGRCCRGSVPWTSPVLHHEIGRCSIRTCSCGDVGVVRALGLLTWSPTVSPTGGGALAAVALVRDAPPVGRARIGSRPPGRAVSELGIEADDVGDKSVLGGRSGDADLVRHRGTRRCWRDPADRVTNDASIDGLYLLDAGSVPPLSGRGWTRRGGPVSTAGGPGQTARNYFGGEARGLRTLPLGPRGTAPFQLAGVGGAQPDPVRCRR